MSSPAAPDDGAIQSAARELARLRGEVERARGELAQLRADLSLAESQLGGRLAAQLLEANEHLVLSALRAQADAETATTALQEASRSAELDALTELPNRVLLRDRLAQAIASARRHATRVALLFLDLNNFKQINDTHGHAMGDQVLKLAASRLVLAVRAADTVSRHGGDEFVILLSEVGHVGDAVTIAGKVGEALAAPSRLNGQLIRLAASIGISLYPDDGEDPGTLIDRADIAMYSAKRLGLCSFVYKHDEASGHPATDGSSAARN